MGLTSEAIETTLDILFGGKIPLILGAPGSGKSMCLNPGGEVFNSLAEYEGVDPSEFGFCDLRPCFMDVSDYRGYPFPNKETKTTEWLVPEFLPRDPDSKGLLVIEEIMNAPRGHHHALYQLTQERRIGDYILPDGWYIAATGNRAEDGCGVGKLPTALVNRFITVEWTPDAKDWGVWASEHGVDYRVIAATRWHPDFIETFDGRISGPQSTGRSVAAFAQILERSNINPTRSDRSNQSQRIFRMAKGAIGEDDAGRMTGFLGLFSRLPDVDAIVNGVSETVDVPKEADVQIAVIAQLARMATPSNIGNILRWVSRATDTMKIIFATDLETVPAMALSRDTAEYRDWRIENSKLFE